MICSSLTDGESAKVTVTGDGVYFQTSPATSIQDSPRAVTSSPKTEGPARGETLDPETVDGGLLQHLFLLLHDRGTSSLAWRPEVKALKPISRD